MTVFVAEMVTLLLWSRDSQGFAVLSAFVAINTVMYVALSVAKMLPKVYLSDWVSHRGRRSETRSIHPDPPPTESGSG